MEYKMIGSRPYIATGVQCLTKQSSRISTRKSTVRVRPYTAATCVIPPTWLR